MQRARILVVEDNTDLALALRHQLEALGYDVATACDGPSALQIARTFTPTIALLDLGLPRMDGYELADRLRAIAEVKLVALSGYDRRADVERTTAAGFARHLVKPVELRELDAILRELSA